MAFWRTTGVGEPQVCTIAIAVAPPDASFRPAAPETLVKLRLGPPLTVRTAAASLETLPGSRPRRGSLLAHLPSQPRREAGLRQMGFGERQPSRAPWRGNGRANASAHLRNASKE